MAKSWYILQTYSGYENKIKDAILSLKNRRELSSEIVFEVKVPSEEITEVKDGKKKTTTRKILPGYIMVEMDLPDLGWKNVCTIIRKVHGVTGFIGAGSSEKPRPLSSEEAAKLLQKSGEFKGDKPRMKQSFVVGEQVKIIDGPFASFTGTIEEVNQEKNKLRVMVGIFGRATPVEVDLLQVEKE